MTLTELESDFKKARRIDFNMNFPKVYIYFDSEIDGEVFYANIGEYFDNQKLSADLDMRNGFCLTIFSIDNAEEIKSEKMECINNVSLQQRLLTSPYVNEKFLFGTGYIHHPSEASIELTTIQHESMLWLERLTIIKG